MKTIKILTFIGLASVLTGSADAVQKCVSLTSSTTCTKTSVVGYAGWSATCSTSGKSISVSGVGACSNSGGSSYGATADSITVENGEDARNKYCWCKMISPAVSTKWVYTNVSWLATDDCDYYCHNYCAAGLANNATFRTALFSNLSD